MSTARAAIVLGLVLLGTAAADSATALEGGRGGLLRRHRGVSTPQATAAPEKTKGPTPRPRNSSNTTRRPSARWKSKPTGALGSPT